MYIWLSRYVCKADILAKRREFRFYTKTGYYFIGDEAPASKPDRSGDASPAPGAGGRDADDKCKRDGECASHEKCMKAGVDKGKQCLDPCLTRRCGTAAVCKTQDHRVFCACKDGFEGEKIL